MFTYKIMAVSKITTDTAPQALGPYSQAIVAGNFIFCSGQIGIDPLTNGMVGGGIMPQTDRAMANLDSILRAAGAGLGDVIKVDVYLKDMGDFMAMNEAYAKHFRAEPKPARVTVGVARLPKDALVELSCIAYRE